MIRTKVFCKQAIFVMFAVASALAAGTASAQSVSSAPAAKKGAALSIVNKKASTTCARAYVQGQQYNLNAAHPGTDLVAAKTNTSYMASVFKGQKCGGAAIKNVWFTTGGGSVSMWDIR